MLAIKLFINFAKDEITSLGAVNYGSHNDFPLGRLELTNPV